MTTTDHEIYTTTAPTADEQYNNGDDNDNDNDNDNNNENGLEFSQFKYGIEAFYAMIRPVTIAMLLSAFCVAVLTSDEVSQQKEQVLSSSYTVWDVGESSSASSAQKLGLSIANGLIIIAFLIVMTFVVVLLYKYRCMKVLYGYFSISVVILLGFLGGDLVLTATAKYNVPVDKFSLFFILYNFAVVGLGAIFYGRGFPTYVKQGYMIAVSVILSWQLAHLNAWTAWILLVLLALYDLYAVLTPYGPLKALVKLMQREDAPDLPGVLYEAQLPSDVRRPNRKESVAIGETEAANNTTESSEPAVTEGDNSNSSQTIQNTISTNYRESASVNPRSSRQAGETGDLPSNENSNVTGGGIFNLSQSTEDRGINESASTQSRSRNLSITPSPRNRELPPLRTSLSLPSPRGDVEVELQRGAEAYPSASVPLAIARLYRLPIVENGVILSVRERFQDITPDQLRANVLVIFPRNGGRIELIPSRRRNREPRYIIIDREGNVKRTVFVGREGKVFEVKQEEDNEKKPHDTVRLGLGDFVFYSLLVAKASMYGYTTFIVSLVVILAGLGLTLLLLSMKGKALPALPISILLGVVFYFSTRYLIQPWVEHIFLIKSYM